MGAKTSLHEHRPQLPQRPILSLLLRRENRRIDRKQLPRTPRRAGVLGRAVGEEHEPKVRPTGQGRQRQIRHLEQTERLRFQRRKLQPLGAFRAFACGSVVCGNRRGSEEGAAAATAEEEGYGFVGAASGSHV